MASALNILGLTIAFAVFIIVMSKFKYETSINKNIKDNQDIYLFSMIMDMGEGEVKNGVISRGMARELCAVSPLVEEHTSIYLFMDKKTGYSIIDRNLNFTDKVYLTTPSIVDVLSLECLEGNFTDFYEPRTAIIPESLAKKYFADSSPIGKIIRREDAIGQVEGEFVELTIVGIYKDIPNNFLENKILENIGNYQSSGIMSLWNFATVIKFKPGSDPQTAIMPMVTKLQELTKAENIESFDAKNISLIPIADLYFSDVMFYSFPKGNKQMLYILLAIALVIIIIATINYTNFFMALLPIRIKSVNINKVFGAPVTALRLNIIFEAVGMMIITFLLSLLVVELVSFTIIRELSESSIRVIDNLGIISYSFAFAIIVGIISGLFPAWYITKFSPSMILKGSFGRSKRGIFLRQTLTTIQFSVSIILLIVASFIMIQNKYMQGYDYGYNRDRLLTTTISNTIAENSDEFSQEIMSSPLFEGITYTFQPINNAILTWGRDFKHTSSSFKVAPVNWNFPEFMEMEMVEGRTFTKADYLKPEGAVIFNETAAREFDLKVGDDFEGHNGTNKIVGIAKDYNYLSLHSPISPACLYLYGKETAWSYLNVTYIRLSPKADLNDAINHVTNSIKKSDPQMPEELISITPFDESIENAYTEETKTAQYITIFSIISIIISLLGVFGIIVFEMQYSRKEVAVRKIFGAGLSSILLRFNKKLIYVLGISSIIAIPISWYTANQWIQDFAFRTPIHWWVFILAIIIVFLVVVTVVNIQTYKAASENPTNNLKSN